MGQDWGFYIFVFIMAAIVMARLDRLGKQLEAVKADIRAAVARSEDERMEILREWKESQKQAAKATGSSGFFEGSSALLGSFGL
jgi:transposase